MTLNDIHNLLAENGDNDAYNVIYAIEPPIEEAEAMSDRDSDDSDDNVTCNPVHLPRRILLSNVSNPSLEKESHVSTQDSQSSKRPPLKRRRKMVYKWHHDKNKVNDSVPDYEENSSVLIRNDKAANPQEIIEQFWTQEWIDNICEQSRLYANQKSLSCNEVNPNNLKVFLGILVLSGYNKLPNRRLYWAESSDTVNQLVSRSMRRDTFDQIMRCLHFTDNMAMNEDRFYKVRPLFEHLNKVSKIRNCTEYTSVDEIMILYYGRHRDKQYIRGKPVRFGFKLWAACTSDGSLLHAEPYCGAYTKIPDRGMGLGANVFLEMAEQLHLQKGHHVVFDNFFGSVALMEALSSNGIAATSTLREDRLRCSSKTTNIDGKGYLWYYGRSIYRKYISCEMER